MIEIQVDGKTIEAEVGSSVLDACLASGIYIPHICSHPDLKPIGACGFCVVEIENMDGLQKSCVTEVMDGMKISTSTDAVLAAREEAMQKKMAGHPADCDSCVKYLNCELQSLKQYILREETPFEQKLRQFPENRDNPIFIHNPAKCIQCGRCVRACHELRQVGVLYFKKRGEDTYVGIGNGDAAANAIVSPSNAAIDAGNFDDLNDEQIVYASSAPDELLADAGCRFCGACAEVCPTGAILDKHEFEDERTKRDALIPCAGTCPAGIDVPRYIRFIKNGDNESAYAVMREKVPFPLSLGYVCSRPCEKLCRRGEINEAISIRNLKRYASETCAPNMSSTNVDIQKKSPTGKKVAVVGGGPAGLSASYYLALLGHDPVIFESMPEIGGMLRYGIPEYRLPQEILSDEVRLLSDIGVHIETEHRVENVAALLSEGYDAVLICIGTGKGSMLKIRGTKGDGVTTAVDFLKSIRLDASDTTKEVLEASSEVCTDISLNPISIKNKNVLVIGGGNVAFDCARTALRLGAATATCAFPEAEDAMTSSDDEINAGMEEGVKLFPQMTFTRIERDEDGAVEAVLTKRVLEMTTDDDGRVNFDIEDDSDSRIDADIVIFAVGQKPDIPEDFGVTLTDRGFIEADTSTMRTEEDGIFATSDCVYGTDSVIKAIASARSAALKIDKFLGGRGRLTETYAPELRPDAAIGKLEGFVDLQRISDRLPPADERLSGFAPSELIMTSEDATSEADRCLACDMRFMITPVKFWNSY